MKMLRRQWTDFEKWLAGIVAAVIVAFLVALTTGVISNSDVDATDVQDGIGYSERKPYKLIYDRWKQGNSEFIRNTGNPGQTISSIDILWYQFFDHGAILYNASSDWSVALFPNKTWEKYDNPLALVTNYDPDRPSIAENIRIIYQGSNYETYLQLFQSNQITGGIGTLYVKHDLLPRLGKPLAFQEWTKDAAYVPGPVYDLLVGLVNTHLDNRDSGPKAVISLIHNDRRIKRFVVYMSESQ